jgi:multiple sugar transport system ATP-binding protein
MGRDTSVVCEHPFFTGENFRAIVDSDDLHRLTGTAVRFAVKPNKVFVFRKETGERIRF